MEHWPEHENGEPMEILREKNSRNRKATHRYRCPVCFKTFQNNSGPIKKHFNNHSEEEIQQWAGK